MQAVRPFGLSRRLRSSEVSSCLLILGTLLLASAREARAQDSVPAPDSTAAKAAEERPTGLPKGVQWTFNLDAGLGAFGFGNSLYTNVRPDPSGDLSDNWFESYVKPALSGSIDLGGGSELYGKVSVVGERTFAAPPPLVGTEAASFGPEELNIGWRSGTSISSSENLIDLNFGRAVYKIGHGMILWDGGAEGGSRGGFWSNARKAWALAAVARLQPKIHTFEAFYLNRNEISGIAPNSRVWGANYQIAPDDYTVIGASYLHTLSDSNAARNGMNVYNVRAYTAPLPMLRDLSIEAEYAYEDNGDLRKSNAWNVQVAYQLSKVDWAPKLSYRYAFFQGDDPATSADESFDPLFPGFYDWGTWWQGEIAGEYFLSNSNLISNQVRLSLTPSEKVGTGLIGYYFQLDQPGALAPGVTSKDVVAELDAYCDWKVNSNFTFSFIAAYANPGAAVEQAFGRTENFIYGMAYISYSY
ncbi:MAG: hypothetical protein H6Q77_2343 [Gemmatimonadetes bacterium]|nr:hypothetical protein [Gemmatimonadota bacterium]